MGGFFDIPTLLITATAASFCICVSLILTWSSSRRDIYILSWAVTFGLAALTMTLVALRGRVEHVLSVNTADALLLAAFGMMWLGYRQFCQSNGRFDRWIAGAGVVIWLIIWATTPYLEDMNVRSRVLSAIESVYFLFIVIGLIRHGRVEPLPSVALTAVLVGAHAAVQLYRVVKTFVAPTDPTTIILPNTLYMGLGLIESSIFLFFLGVLQLSIIGQRSERRYRMVAESDALTGLANRRHFLDCILPSLIADDRGALILFDIDHFKSVNDTHGHPAGDRALAEFAATLAAATPPGGIAARIGGEEFALFLPKAATDEAAELADRIRCVTADLRVVTTAGIVSVTVSCGVAGVSEVGPDFQNLHAAADHALYAAKSAGRNQVAVHRLPPATAQACPSGEGMASLTSR